MSWNLIVQWFFLALTILFAGISWRNWRKNNRNIDRLRALYLDEAAPVEAVEVHLKTGEMLLVQPIDPMRNYVWSVPIPVNKEMVDEIVIPVLPPYTSIVPIPKEMM